MKHVCLALLMLVSFLWNITYAQQKLKYSQVKIFVPHNDVASLQKGGLDLDHAYYNPVEKSLTTTLDANEIKKLAKFGVKYEIVVDDEETDFLKRNRPEEFYKYDDTRNTGSNGASRLMFNTPDKSFAGTVATPAAFTAGSMGGYHTFTEMVQLLNNMATNYPNLVKLQSIGKTYENRDIWAVTISDYPDSVEVNEPEILFTGMHHAREPLAMENLVFFMQYLLENYSTNNSIKEIVNSRKLMFIPCLNPDGYVYNQTTNPSGGGMWRKNRQPNPSDASNPGQDLNRNYGYGFNYPNGGSSSLQSDPTYHGDFAFQANETQIIRSLLRAHSFQYAVNYHSYGGYWIHGNTVPTYAFSHTDSAIVRTTGAFATHHSAYLVGTPMETVGYQGNGTIEDWCMAGDAGVRPPVYCISPEVGLGLTTFWPTSANIIPYCKEVFFGNLQVCLFGGAYTDIDERTNTTLSTKTGNLNFVVRRIGRVDSSVKVTVYPYQNVSSTGAPATVASLPNYLDSSLVSVGYTLYPTITDGQRVKFIVKTETGGITKLDTIVKLYSSTSLSVFSDDMEGTLSSKWTSSTWGYSTASAFKGGHSLSESPSGNYASNSSSTITTASTFSLTGATAAYLSFWTRYKTQNGYDKLQIQVSTNGTTYTPLAGIHTITESKGTLGNLPALSGYQDYWVREVVDLKSVLGSSTVRLRFAFSSDGSTTDEGFFLDEVEVVRTTAPLVILPVHFMSVSAARVGSSVTVKWDANTQADHLYFEVERSVDGQTFTPIYKTTDGGQYFYATDASPFIGTNYYRIKEVSSGGSQYSKTVQVLFNSEGLITLFPNPVDQNLQLRVNGLVSGRYQMQIISVAGAVAAYREFDVSNASQLLNVNTGGLSSGAYYLCVRKENGELVEVKNFSKL